MKNIPIATLHLFPALEAHLIELLHSLTPEEWNAPTIARLWNVKDVAGHLLDGNIRMMSMTRDNYMGDPPGNITGYDDLVAYLNGLNADWVRAMKRMSPKVLIALMETTGQEYCRIIAAEDPFAAAKFSVSWAGESSSVNWFHIAREYTERWHHQQQIRDAVNKPGISTRELYYPALDTFMMALPHTYRNVHAAEGTVVKITVTGDAGGEWFLTKNDHWVLSKESTASTTAHTTIDGSVAWKLFTKSWRQQNVMPQVKLEGTISLAKPVLDMISVMA